MRKFLLSIISLFVGFISVFAQAGFTVTPTTLSTFEKGATAFFEVKLNQMPTADVTIPISSTDITEGAANSSSLVFTTVNWETPQKVIVTPNDDFIGDGNVLYTIILGTATSTDPAYNGLDPIDVMVTNIDDDFGNIIIIESTVNEVNEGANTTFTIRGLTAPTADVTFMITSADPSVATLSLDGVSFSNAVNATIPSSNNPVTITVMGVDNAVIDGDQTIMLTTGSTSSTDASLNGVDPIDVVLIRRDNDVATVVVVENTTIPTMSEWGLLIFGLLILNLSVFIIFQLLKKIV